MDEYQYPTLKQTYVIEKRFVKDFPWHQSKHGE
jgi:hypothetical protein